MNVEQFNNQFSVLTEVYGKNYSAQLKAIFYGKFKHLTQEQFSLIIQSYMSENQYMPKLNDLLDLMPDSLKVTTLHQTKKPSLAWCENTQKLLDEYSVNSQFNDVFNLQK